MTAINEDLRMRYDRHIRPRHSQDGREAFDMVDMAVADNDTLYLAGIQAEEIQIMHDTDRALSGVQQYLVLFGAGEYFEQAGKAMFGERGIRRDQRRPSGDVGAFHEHVRVVVDQGDDFQPVRFPEIQSGHLGLLFDESRLGRHIIAFSG